MRVLSPVVEITALPVSDLRQDLALRHSVAPEAVGDQAPWFILQSPQQALEEALGSSGVPAILHEDVEHDTVLINRTPEIMLHAVDAQKYLVQMPSVARLWSPSAQLVSKAPAEL